VRIRKRLALCARRLRVDASTVVGHGYVSGAVETEKRLTGGFLIARSADYVAAEKRVSAARAMVNARSARGKDGWT